MIVSIRAGERAEPVVVLQDREDLTRLHVEADVDDAGADAALRASGLGHLDGDHAWLSVAALGAPCPGDAVDRPERYAAMIAYAAGKGWCSADGAEVQAHVERTQHNG